MNHRYERTLVGKRFETISLAFFLLVLICVPATGVAQNSDSSEPEFEKLEFSGTTMGPIPYRVVVRSAKNARSESELQELADLIDGELEHVNKLMSTYQPDSDISRFNRAKVSEWVEVHPDTVTVVSRALKISEVTDGAFDITVGPAVKLWKFGTKKDEKFALPSDKVVASTQSRVGWSQIEIRNDPPSLRKSVSGLEIDLSAIAKGYAVDKVAQMLKGKGEQNVLVEVGGEVYAMGKSAPSKLWRVGIEKPQQGFRREIQSVAEIQDRGMATSGDYRNFHVLDGKRYSHTIDPKTCRPVLNRVATTCVIADDCMTADAYATAFMVTGPKVAAEIAEDVGLEYFMLERQKSDPLQAEAFIVSQSSTFPSVASPGETGQGTVGKVKERGILPVFLAAAIVFALAIFGMAAGAIFGNRQLQGSCGGLANMSDGEDSDCSLCDNSIKDCPETAA